RKKQRTWSVDPQDGASPGVVPWALRINLQEFELMKTFTELVKEISIAVTLVTGLGTVTSTANAQSKPSVGFGVNGGRSAAGSFVSPTVTGTLPFFKGRLQASGTVSQAFVFQKGIPSRAQPLTVQPTMTWTQRLGRNGASLQGSVSTVNPIPL